MRRSSVCPFFFLLLALSGAAPGAAGTDNGASCRRELRETARALKLHDDRYWNVLLHYKQGLLGRKSLIDDRRFFLSPRGKTDPEGELMATIDGLFSDEKEEKLAPGCRFPARFAWLKDRLSIDPSRLPEIRCPAFDNALSLIAPRSAALIFASGHMNAPASMFGHTLLRFDSSYESPLLSYAVNYAATVDRRDSGVLYAFKGIFGLYSGFYSLLPYYEKVKEYRNMDQRDLWEYRLNLSEEEVRRMLLHVWELQGISSDYYFFKENCSYNLLFLLEAASPGASLTDRFSSWTIPADTLKAAIAEGLVSEPVFRSSQAGEIRHMSSFLDEREVGMARAVLDGAMTPGDVVSSDISEAGKARVLDIVAESIQLRYGKRRLAVETFQSRFLAVLGARSAIRPTDNVDAPPAPLPALPESGHGSSRASLGLGVREDDLFLELAFRPAYHELIDPDDGYTAGSQIDFLAATARYYPEPDRFRLHRMDIISIVSLAERDPLFRPVSWKIHTGFVTKDFAPDRDSLVYVLSPGGGFAWRNRRVGLFSLMLETQLGLSRRYDSDYAVGVGGSAAILRQMTPSWKALLSLRHIEGIAGDTRRGRETQASLRQSVRVTRNVILILDAGRTMAEEFRIDEASLSWNRYF